MTKEQTPLKWKFKTGDGVSGSAVLEGIVYFGSYDKHLYAVDTKTGEEKWKFKTENIVQSPVLSDNVVYFGSYDKHLYAVDTKTGEEKWKFDTGGQGFFTPVLAVGFIYYGTHDIYKINAKTGEIKWKFETGLSITSSAALSEGMLYFGCNDNCLYCVDIKNGNLIWKIQANSYLRSNFVISDSILYFASGTDLFAVDCKTGKEKWKLETGDSVRSIILSDNVIYFGSWDNHLHAVNCKTGKEKWKFETGDSINSIPAISHGVVYLGSDDFILYAIDCDTGKMKWEFEAEEGISSSPTISEGIIYFGSRDKHLYAVDINIAEKLAPLRKKEKQRQKELEMKKMEEEKHSTIKKAVSIQITGNGIGVEYSFADIPDDLREFYIKNKNKEDLDILIEDFYDNNIRDEWYKFGESTYGLTPDNNIEVNVEYEDGTSELFVDGYEEIDSKSEEYEFENGMIHKSWERGHMVDAELFFDEPVEFKIKNLKFNFNNYESNPPVLGSISYKEKNDELAFSEDLYSMHSTTGKGIDVEIRIEGKIIFVK